jgi:hypothetical protein
LQAATRRTVRVGRMASTFMICIVCSFQVRGALRSSVVGVSELPLAEADVLDLAGGYENDGQGREDGEYIHDLHVGVPFACKQVKYIRRMPLGVQKHYPPK